MLQIISTKPENVVIFIDDETLTAEDLEALNHGSKE